MIAPASMSQAVDSRQVARAFVAVFRVARITADITQEDLAERAYCDRT